MLRLAASRGGGPETRSGTVQSLKCCPCQQKRAARLQSAAPGSIEGGAPKRGHRPEPEVLPLPAETSREAQKAQHRNALGHRPEPEVLPLPAETSREARKCWGGGPETRSGTVHEVLPLPAETSREARKCCAWQHQGGGGPETRSGTVQSLKCCPCQQKRAAARKCCACIEGGGAPKRARAA